MALSSRFAAAALALAVAGVAGPAGVAVAEEADAIAKDAVVAGDEAPAAGDAPSQQARAAEPDLEAAPGTARLSPLQVTATRSQLPVVDPTASVEVVGERETKTTAARTIDDVLRRIPGFSLFRRLGSSVANPTAQGVSLRGIGPSGTSRALVLVDGVPLNDPFGGWVHWNRIPGETIRQVEVLRGSGASLWGNYAMGGVIGVVTRDPEDEGQGLLAEGGERGGGRTEGWVARRMGDTAALVDARWMRSSRFPVVNEASRGPIDVSAGSEHGTGGLRLSHRVSDRVRLRATARGYRDDRDNGTPYQHNRTTIGSFGTGVDVDAGDAGRVVVDVFAAVQEYQSTFSAVSPDRTSETPASDQFDVPSQSAGGSAVWSGEAVRHRLAAGVDAMWVDGGSRELARSIDGAFTRVRDGGSTQAMAGVFVEDLYAVADTLDVTAALRLDWWTSYDMFRNEVDVATGAELADRDLGSREETLLSPRLGAAWAATDALLLRAAAYRGFRAPTINEQIRPFRVRNDITEANAGLDAEKLTGVEGGADAQRGRWRGSATVFWNEIEDPVFNVTLGDGGAVVEPCGFVPAGGTCRQRRNLGRTEVVGIETGVGVDLGRGFGASAAYLWSHGEVASAPEAPSLDGNRLPQVPRHQGTIALDYDAGEAWRAALEVRIVGQAWDDDANTRSLDRFATVDLFVARKIGRGFEVFAAGENLLDATVQTGRSADGVVSIGAPRLVRAGLRYAFGDDD